MYLLSKIKKNNKTTKQIKKTKQKTKKNQKKTIFFIGEWNNFETILSILSYMIKAPLVPKGTPIVNALMKQQRCITNVLCALVGLPPDSDMLLEHKTKIGERN